jgi:hypothetical protein
MISLTLHCSLGTHSPFLKTENDELLHSSPLPRLHHPSRGGRNSKAIVYGPKAGFDITAPEKWVVDHTAGAEDGLPCVLFPKGQSWETADPLMYAKVASAECVFDGSF